MQRRINDLETSQSIKGLLNSDQIIKTKTKLLGGRNPDIYLVELDNGLLAVFKKREGFDLQGEVMAYEIATHLFGLPSTIPPTIKKNYKGMTGILQYYIPSDLILDDGKSVSYDALEKMTANLSHESYANLQLFKYLAGLKDFNISSLVTWLNPNGQYALTSVDNEFINPNPEKYGDTLFGKIDITYGYSSSAYLSSWTSFFNHGLIYHIKKITRDDYINLLKINDFYESADEIEWAEAAADGFIHNCNQILAWVGSKQQRLAAVTGTLFSPKTIEEQASISAVSELISDYDFKIA